MRETVRHTVLEKFNILQSEQGENYFFFFFFIIQQTNEKLKLKTIKGKHRAQHLSDQITESRESCHYSFTSLSGIAETQTHIFKNPAN